MCTNNVIGSAIKREHDVNVYGDFMNTLKTKGE